MVFEGRTFLFPYMGFFENWYFWLMQSNDALSIPLYGIDIEKTAATTIARKLSIPLYGIRVGQDAATDVPKR